MWTELAKFLAKRVVKEEDHLLWAGTRLSAGYGQAEWRGRKYRAHRLAYMLHHKLESLPPDTVVVQTCGVRLCVNPEHLAVISKQEHSKLTAAKRVSDTCPHGHTRTPGTRCKECFNAYMRRYQKSRRLSNGPVSGNHHSSTERVVGSYSGVATRSSEEGGSGKADE